MRREGWEPAGSPAGPGQNLAARGGVGRGFSRVAAAFSSYDGDLSLPLGLALGSPIFPSGCKQEMTRVNVDILGISDLKWTGMGEFNSDDHYIYYCRQESLRRNGVAIMVNKSPKCSTWMQSQKRQNDLCSFPRQSIQYHDNPSLCSDQ